MSLLGSLKNRKIMFELRVVLYCWGGGSDNDRPVQRVVRGKWHKKSLRTTDLADQNVLAEVPTFKIRTFLCDGEMQSIWQSIIHDLLMCNV